MTSKFGENAGADLAHRVGYAARPGGVGGAVPNTIQVLSKVTFTVWELPEIPWLARYPYTTEKEARRELNRHKLDPEEIEHEAVVATLKEDDQTCMFTGEPASLFLGLGLKGEATSGSTAEAVITMSLNGMITLRKMLDEAIQSESVPGGAVLGFPGKRETS